MKRLVPLAVFALVLVLVTAGAASAALFNLTGTIIFHNDVAFTSFTLNSPSPSVNLWTDSFIPGFDPIISVFDSAGNLITYNDDNSGVGPGQDYWDSGLTMGAMGTGTYTVTVAAYNNFAYGPNLSNGFYHDGETGIPIAAWGGYNGDWSLWFDGVDSVNGGTPEVLEPTTVTMLLLLGVPVAVKAVRRRRNRV
jgi:hypothetical protein